VELKLIQIDAFAERLFEGNPAAVMPLPRWLDNGLLARLAAENNLSETAFFVPEIPPAAGASPFEGPTYHLRWFTPAIEVDLCGHATLATAGYLFDEVHPDVPGLAFWTRSGWLGVKRAKVRQSEPSRITLDFPADVPVPVDVDPAVVAALGIPIKRALKATDLIYLADSADAIRSMAPDFSVLRALSVRGLAVTAAGDEDGIDFVSRWFGGAAGIDEDPVTGSAHAQLAPYWAQLLSRDDLTARQLSSRGGTVHCLLHGERVRLTGGYVRYSAGTVVLPTVPGSSARAEPVG
jgi:PhzF family phenazine biosynthesis protein